MLSVKILIVDSTPRTRVFSPTPKCLPLPRWAQCCLATCRIRYGWSVGANKLEPGAGCLAITLTRCRRFPSGIRCFRSFFSRHPALSIVFSVASPHPHRHARCRLVPFCGRNILLQISMRPMPSPRCRRLVASMGRVVRRRRRAARTASTVPSVPPLLPTPPRCYLPMPWTATPTTRSWTQTTKDLANAWVARGHAPIAPASSRRIPPEWVYDSNRGSWCLLCHTVWRNTRKGEMTLTLYEIHLAQSYRNKVSHMQLVMALATLRWENCKRITKDWVGPWVEPY